MPFAALRRSVATAALVLALLTPATAALAQDPFTPPSAPPAAPPTPTPDDDDNAALDPDGGTQTLFIIAGVLLVGFVVIGVWMARDARRAVPEHARHRGARGVAEPAPGVPAERKRDPQARARARKKTRAQKRARRHNRP
jgi:hypothetical protein